MDMQEIQVPKDHQETRALLALRAWWEPQEQMESREHGDAMELEVHKDHRDHPAQGDILGYEGPMVLPESREARETVV